MLSAHLSPAMSINSPSLKYLCLAMMACTMGGSHSCHLVTSGEAGKERVEALEGDTIGGVTVANVPVDMEANERDMDELGEVVVAEHDGASDADADEAGVVARLVAEGVEVVVAEGQDGAGAPAGQNLRVSGGRSPAGHQRCPSSYGVHSA
mmetsp:Transcript_59813/g.144487  ORF Transcript_59813/g.144487 Transcript_59813/m.144487 type:complete len:151 (-) Transcript_59813:55-507(-)